MASDLRLPRAVLATGVPPEHRRVADLTEAVPAAVTELLAQVVGTVGVITPVGRWDEVAGWLVADPRVRVVTSLEAKGIGYDGVVLVEPAQIEAQPAGTSTLYVVLSRATQRLVTVTATAPRCYRPSGSTTTRHSPPRRRYVRLIGGGFTTAATLVSISSPARPR